ncbi:MAG: HDOD domain-containing protein [Sedimenticola sp.]
MNAARIDVGKLPVVPQVLLKLIDACHKVDVSFDELGGIIKQDATLCTKMISVANSPLYTQWRNVDDLNRLLVVLGVERIKTIAVTSVVQQFFSQFNADVGKQMGTFWKESLTCACMMKSLAKLTGYESADEAYIAGLLHNLGQLVYLKRHSGEYLEMLNNAQSDAELDELERERFGATCTEVGAYLLNEWIPGSFVSDAILFQHEPAERIFDTQPLIKLLNLAHKLSDGGISESDLLSEADRLYSLTQPMLDELQESVRSEVLDTAQAFGIKIDLEDNKQTVHNVDDEETRLELAKQVRGYALFGTSLGELNPSANEESVWHGLLQDLDILFGFDKAMAFRFSEESGQLQDALASAGEEEQIRQIQIPLTSGRSLAAESLIEKKILTSFDTDLPELTSVLDRQLKRILQSAELICLPLLDGTARFGVLIAGTDDNSPADFATQKTLLSQFLQASSNRILAQQQRAREQEELLEAQRAQQNLRARKLVHEANNPLGVIKNYLQVLSIKLANDDSVNEQLGLIRDEIDRVAGIILRMRDTEEAPSPNDGPVDINQVVEDLVSLFRVSMFTTHGITDQLQLDLRLPPVMTNRNSLKQILTNLMKNAVEAMPEGGELTVSTQGNVNIDGRSYVQITVADSGPGLPAETLSKLFSPIESSKGKQHAGLGLTIAKNLIADMDGSISCRNREKMGAEFIFMLPQIKGNSLTEV